MSTIEIDAGYFKTGEDWHSMLEASGGNVPKALVAWASAMERKAGELRALADAVESLDPHATGEGSTHYAAIYTSNETAAKIRRRKNMPIMRWKRVASDRDVR